MSARAPSVCSEPGCSELVPSGRGRCPRHHTEQRRAYDRRRIRTQSYADKRWRITRAEFLSTHLTCEHEDGCIRPATDVHHLDGQGHAGRRGHDPSNLQALCKSHHSKVTATEHPAGWAAR